MRPALRQSRSPRSRARQQLNSSPYSIQTVNAQQLGGVPADQYVKTDDPRLGGSGGNFIQNTTTQQADANFNIGGNGFIGGNVGIGTTSALSKLTVRTGTFNPYGFTHTNGTVTLGTFVDNNGGWLGTRSNSPLYFFTNDGLPQATLMPSGEFGIGVTPDSGIKLDVGGNGRFRTANGNINLGSPNGETGLRSPTA